MRSLETTKAEGQAARVSVFKRILESDDLRTVNSVQKQLSHTQIKVSLRFIFSLDQEMKEGVARKFVWKTR